MTQGRSALGPRLRRRLIALAAIAGVMVVAAGLIYHDADYGDTSSAQNHAPRRKVNLAMWNTLGIAYGATPKQVLRQLGSPTAKHGDCWIYQGQPGRIRGRFPNPYTDAFKFCFGEGPTGGKAVVQITGHSAAHAIVMKNPITGRMKKKRFPAEWSSVTYEMPPEWYLQENS